MQQNRVLLTISSANIKYVGIDLKKKMFWYNLVNQLYISKKKGVLYMEKNDKTIETGCKQVERYIVFVN